MQSYKIQSVSKSSNCQAELNEFVTRSSRILSHLIIHETNLLHSQSLFLVEILFVLQNSLIEELLQFFVAIIDAKLLERVHREVLEA